MTSSRVILSTGRVVPYRTVRPQTTYKDLPLNSFFPHQLIVVKRDLALTMADKASRYIRSLGDEAVNAYDMAFNWELVLSGELQFYSPSCYKWREHREQIHRKPCQFHQVIDNHYRTEFKSRYGSN